MRILVIQTAFVGDVVLTTPFLAALRSKWPAASLHVVSTPQGCEVLEGIEGLTCHPLDKRNKGFLQGIREVRTSLGTEKFDFVFCVHRSFRSLYLGRVVRADRRIAFRSVTAALFDYETVSYPPYREQTHYADKPMRLLSVVGETENRPNPGLAVLSGDAQRVNALLKGADTTKGYVVVSPFSVWGTKMWFAERYARAGAAISKRLGVPIILTGGNTAMEMTVAQTIVEKIADEGGVALSLVGQTSLGELKALIARSRLVIANDSAPVHIAAAFDVPTVAIFGPTVRRWGFFPLASRSEVVERSDVPCRPCHIHGPPRCPKRHFACMDKIQIEDVVKAVERVLV